MPTGRRSRSSSLGVQRTPITTSRSTTSGLVSAPGHEVPREHSNEGSHVNGSAQEQVEFIVRTVAQTALDNEKYFGDLDAVVGDGDFGYSLGRGFEKLLEGWDDLDRSDVGTFLKRVGMVITSRIGGTSGPIWGTGVMKAGTTGGATATPTGGAAAP